MKFRIGIILPVLLFILTGCTNKSSEQRIDNLIGQLTLQEKLDLLGGTGFATKAVERLGIPEIKMTDGPIGVRWKKSTCLPSSIAMAASWDPDLVRKLGVLLGEEARAHGRNMLLGPCVNIDRVPMGGRSFESFGEDPYLTSRMTVAYIKGVQSEHVIACVKHFVANNQEHNRTTVDTRVDERALREIYLPAFKAAVQEAGVLTVMSAYNKLNGYYCSANDWLLNKVLKQEWGFNGFVVSDWGAVHSIFPTVENGLDLEMPTGKYMNPDSLTDAVQSGKVNEKIIDDKIRRILRVMFKTGLFEAHYAKDKGALNTPEHQQLALKAAQESIVLLKNENNILPLDLQKIKTLAIIGPNAAVNREIGGGSARVVPFYSVSPLQGLQDRLGENTEVLYARGCLSQGDIEPLPANLLQTKIDGKMVHGLKAEFFDNRDLSGTPVITRVDSTINFDWQNGSPDSAVSSDNFSARWSGFIVANKTADYEIGTISDDGVRLFIDGKKVIEDWSDHAATYRSANVKLKAGKPVPLVLEYYENGGGAIIKMGWSMGEQSLMAEALQIAKKADATVMCAGLSEFIESEGFDRPDIKLPANQVKLINAMAQNGKPLIVVMNSGAPVKVNDWLDNAQAYVQVWYPGEEGGHAIADVLLGNVNPSGKMPVTFPKRWEDSPAFNHYPGDSSVTYSEGIFVGYRYFDKQGIEPQFPFGYGLSYTTFSLGEPTVSKSTLNGEEKITLTVNVKNTGNIVGAEVIQLYVDDVEATVPRPDKELKGFKKVFLKPGESKDVTFAVSVNDLKFFDPLVEKWRAETGTFDLLVGTSSRVQDLKMVSISYQE